MILINGFPPRAEIADEKEQAELRRAYRQAKEAKFSRCCNAPLLNVQTHKCVTCGKAYLA